MIILGVNASFQYGTTDTAAALIVDGRIIGACEEERFTRVKFAPHRVPVNAMRWLLKRQKISIADVDVLAFNIEHNPKFEEPMRRFLKEEFGALPKRLQFYNHHLAHAASGFWGSGFSEAAVLSYDYSGDGLCVGLYHGQGRDIRTLETRATRTGQSLGKYYAAFTQALGFARGDEYKVMGLSAYGNRDDLVDFRRILEVSEDDYRIESRIFSDQPMSSMQEHVFDGDFLRSLGIPTRHPDEPINDQHRRLAVTAQVAFEEASVALARRLKRVTGSNRLVMTGGCALNCVAVSRIRATGLFEEVSVPPAAGDSGTALGAAYLAAAEAGDALEPVLEAGLGPDFTQGEIGDWLKVLQVDAESIDDPAAAAAADIADGRLVGWFQGRSEYGARALGHRSILANPCDPSMQDTINKRVKFRETFRPFAPSVIEDRAAEFFEDAAPSPFMTIVFDVKDPKRIPAVTHVDGTARVQTVHRQSGDDLYLRLLLELEKSIGVPMTLNTSYNINGQPIVNTPHEAIYTFYASGLDVLFVGNNRVRKR